MLTVRSRSKPCFPHPSSKLCCCLVTSLKGHLAPQICLPKSLYKSYCQCHLEKFSTVTVEATWCQSTCMNIWRVSQFGFGLCLRSLVSSYKRNPTQYNLSCLCGYKNNCCWITNKRLSADRHGTVVGGRVFWSDAWSLAQTHRQNGLWQVERLWVQRCPGWQA